MNGVKQIQEGEFKGEVLESGTPVLVDFFAPWCGPCRALAPALEGIAKAYEGRLAVVKVNVDEAQRLAGSYRVQAVPTLIIFKDGKAVDTMVGVPSASALRAKLDAVANEPAAVCGGGCCCN
jgi:thioredoxin 1